MVLVDLVYNLALLVALSVVSGFVEARWGRTTRRGVLLQGLVFGGAAVIGMLRPFVFSPGLIFDGRSVMISLGGLFFGPWTAAVACLMTIPLRVLQGGPGEVMGVLVILSSAALGVGFHLRWRGRLVETTAAALLWFGFVVHVAMLAMMLALPPAMILPVLQRIGWPVLLAYPLATVLIGKILSDQAARAEFLVALQESEGKYRSLVENAREAVFVVQQGVVQYINGMGLRLCGRPEADVVGHSILEFVPPEDGAEVAENHRRLLRGEIAGGQREYRLLGPGGTTVWLSVNRVRISWRGQPATLNLASDIGERKRAGEEMARQIAELQRWQKATLGRERRIAEVKREVNQLLVEAGRPPRYERVEGEGEAVAE